MLSVADVGASPSRKEVSRLARRLLLLLEQRPSPAKFVAVIDPISRSTRRQLSRAGSIFPQFRGGVGVAGMGLGCGSSGEIAAIDCC